MDRILPTIAYRPRNVAITKIFVVEVNVVEVVIIAMPSTIPTTERTTIAAVLGGGQGR
jgi:hypothetical protein